MVEEKGERERERVREEHWGRTGRQTARRVVVSGFVGTGKNPFPQDANVAKFLGTVSSSKNFVDSHGGEEDYDNLLITNKDHGGRRLVKLLYT